jgi:hypothetical protein
MPLGIDDSCLFRACHWMAADEVFLHPEGVDVFMDIRFGASHVCQNTIFL